MKQEAGDCVCAGMSGHCVPGSVAPARAMTICLLCDDDVLLLTCECNCGDEEVNCYYPYIPVTLGQDVVCQVRRTSAMPVNGFGYGNAPRGSPAGPALP